MLCVCIKRVCVCYKELVCKAVRLTFSCQTSAISLPFILIPCVVSIIQDMFTYCTEDRICILFTVTFRESLLLFLIKLVHNNSNTSLSNVCTKPNPITLLYIQGYPQRKRLQRRLFEISTVSFLLFMIPRDCKLVSFFAK